MMIRTTLTSFLIGVASLFADAPAEAADRVLRWETVLDCSVEDAWAAFTTKEGLEAWAVPLAEVDLRIGGSIKTNYDKEAGIGGPGTIVHHILSFEPRQMISSRFEAPANARVAKVAEASWGVTRFESLGPKRTRVILSSCGWGDGAEWDEAEKFFQAGNKLTLEKLRKRFADDGAAERSAEIMRLLGSLVGGEWIHESTRPEGGLFRVRSVYAKGPDGESVVAQGYLGDAEGMTPHGAFHAWREPCVAADGGVRFQNIDENGSVSRGEITLPEPKHLVYDWKLQSREGRTANFAVDLRVTGPDEYRFTLHRVEGEKRTQMVDIVFRRVAEAPEAFRKVRSRSDGPEQR